MACERIGTHKCDRIINAQESGESVSRKMKKK